MADEAPAPVEEPARESITKKQKIKFIASQTWRFFFTIFVPLFLCIIFLWKPGSGTLPPTNPPSTANYSGWPEKCIPSKPPTPKAVKFTKAPYGLYVTVLMAAFWVSECLPLAVTSFIPIALLPIFGIASSDEICAKYFSAPIIFLAGGCVIALAFEYSNLHTRIALLVMKSVGAQASILLGGMMFTCMILSCWMNNTSTTAMMVPVIYSIMDQYKKKLLPEGTPQELARKFGIPSDKDPSIKQSNQSIVPVQNEPPADPVNERKSRASEATKKSQKSIVPSERKSEAPADPEAVAYWENHIATNQKMLRKTEIMLLIGVAASSNIGGTGVLTGTATNLIATKTLVDSKNAIRDRENQGGKFDKCLGQDFWEVDFSRWIILNFLPMFVSCIVSWIFLAIYYEGFPRSLKKLWRKHILKKHPTSEEILEDKERKELSVEIHHSITEKYKNLGGITLHESLVLVLFFILVLLWIFANPLFGRGPAVLYKCLNDTLEPTTLLNVHKNCYKGKNPKLKYESTWGWSRFFGDKCDDKAIHDYNATFLICFLLFVLPKDAIYYKKFFRGGFDVGLQNPVLSLDFLVKNLPWGPLIMLGGGFGVSMAIADSKLQDYLKETMQKSQTLARMTPNALLGVILFAVSILTTVASNTATAVIVSPVLITLARTKGFPPLYFLIPPIVGASYSFILPISTPPNAIVYDKANMKQKDMIVPGIFLTIICNVVLYFFTITYLKYVLNVAGYKGECNTHGAAKDPASRHLHEDESAVDKLLIELGMMD